MFKDHRHIDTYFINNEKTIVETIWADEDDVVRTMEIEADDNDPQWQQLLEHLSVDDIHEATYRNIREQNQSFKDTILKIASEGNDWVSHKDELNRNTAKSFISILFSQDVDDKNAKEKLFMYKLELFEMDEIKNSTDREAKKALRKSESIAEATYIACKIFLNSGT